MKLKKFKLKTRKAALKRIQINKSGHFKFRRSNRSHLNAHMSSKLKRRIRRNGILHHTNVRIVRRLIIN